METPTTVINERIEKLVSVGIDRSHAILIDWDNIENKEVIPTKLLIEVMEETPSMVPKREDVFSLLVERVIGTVEGLQLLWYKLSAESKERKEVWGLIVKKSKTLDDFQWLLMEAACHFDKIEAWRFIVEKSEEILAE